MDNDTEQTNSSWEHARAYANLLGGVPSSFTTAIRQIKNDLDKGIAMQRSTAFQTNRLCHSPSLSASLLAAAKVYYPEMNITSDAALVTGLPMDALAGMIATAYFHRKAKKVAAEDEWTHYSKGLANRVHIAGILGKSLPRVGICRGILAGAMDIIALTCFHLHDKKGFTEYRRYLKTKNIREDVTYEFERWGCNRYNVASILIQSAGFGVDFSNAYATGMLSTDTEEKSLNADAYCFRLVRLWLDALEKSGKEPDRAIRVEYYPEANELSHLTDTARALNSSPLAQSWLDKTKEDIEVIDEASSEEE